MASLLFLEFSPATPYYVVNISHIYSNEYFFYFIHIFDVLSREVGLKH